MAWFAVPVLVLAACGGDGDSAADWCTVAQSVEVSEDALDAVSETDPEAFGQALQAFHSEVQGAVESAPDEISDDVVAAADGIGRFDDILAGIDYDFEQLDEESFGEIVEAGTQIEDAVAAIDAYNEAECGIVPDDDE